MPRAALAADWYVDASAASGGDGSHTRPFKTMNAALAGMSAGDTMWLASGTYDETVNFWKLSGSGTTTVRAMPGATPVIDGTSGSASAGYVLQAGTPDMVFEGLTVQNSGGDGIEVYYSDGVQVLDCTTTGITGAAVVFYYSNQGTVSDSKLQGGVSGRRSAGTVVQRSEIYGCTTHEGITIYDGSTDCKYLHNVIHDNYSVNLYLDSISHSVIDGNLIYESAAGNSLVGIEISDETYSDLPAPVNSYNTIVNNVIVGHQSGIQFWSGDFPASAGSGLKNDVISNNTLVNNVGGIKWDSGAHSGTTVQNNIVVADSAAAPAYFLQANSTTGVTIDHNLWYAPSVTEGFLWASSSTAHAGFAAASGQGAGDVLADPKLAGSWTAPPATNLELATGSPAIGAGVTVSSVPDDFLGALRPAHGPYDIGAFQYGAIVPDGGAAPPPPAGDAGASATSDASSAGDGAVVGLQDAATSGPSGSPDGGSPASNDASPSSEAGAGHGFSSGGCGCTVPGPPRGGVAGAFASFAALLVTRTRRQRSRTGGGSKTPRERSRRDG